ncbi:MAG: hypothetical protein ABI417_12405 [Coleofasciculaceae cyanobacterium]
MVISWLFGVAVGEIEPWLSQNLERVVRYRQRKRDITRVGTEALPLQ